MMEAIAKHRFAGLLPKGRWLLIRFVVCRLIKALNLLTFSPRKKRLF